MSMNQDYAAQEPRREEIDAIAEPVVVEFGAPWCGYCRAAQPLIQTAFDGYTGFRHFKIEDGSGRKLGRSFGIKLWPTLVFLRAGKEVARVVRPDSAEVVSKALACILN